MTATLLKDFGQLPARINSRELVPCKSNHSSENSQANRSISNALVFFAVFLVHLLIALMVLKLPAELPTISPPEQAMTVSLLEDAPAAPIVKKISAESKTPYEVKNHVVNPQTKPAVKPQITQNNLPIVQEPASQPVVNETKVSKESTPAPVTHTDVADARNVSEASQKTVKEPETKEDVKQDVVEPPRFGVAYLNNPKPNYPNLSHRAGEQGRVLFKVLVGVNGEAETVEIAKTSGFDRLDQAGLDAVKQWRFVPAKKNNQAISAYVVVPVNFSLDK